MIEAGEKNMNRFNNFKFIQIMKQVQVQHYFKGLWLDVLLYTTLNFNKKQTNEIQFSQKKATTLAQGSSVINAALM